MTPEEVAREIAIQDQLVSNVNPHRKCERDCHHDLARGVLVTEELLLRDGPEEAPLILDLRPGGASVPPMLLVETRGPLGGASRPTPG